MHSHRLLFLLLALAVVGCDDGESTAVDAASVDASDPDMRPTPDMTADATPDAALDMAPDSAPDMAADMGPPPAPAVGYIAESITYAPAAPDAERTLPVFWWYPTADDSGPSVSYRSLFPAERVFADVAPAVEAPLPLLVFSHGRSGFGQYSFFLTEYFARQGYVVVALDHTGDTLGAAADSPDIYRARPQDISAVIDHALGLPADHPLAGAIGGPVVVVGHSFGGYTALASAGSGYDVETFAAECPARDHPFCVGYQQTPALYAEGFGDPRVEAIVAMAPGNYTQLSGGLDAIDIPVLLITAHGDRNNPDAVDGDPIWSGLADDPRHRRLRFTTGGHFTFTSICLIVGPLGRDNGCDDHNIPPDAAHPIVNAYVGAFFDRHIRGGADADGDALLDGDPPFEDVLLERKAEP